MKSYSLTASPDVDPASGGEVRAALQTRASIVPLGATR